MTPVADRNIPQFYQPRIPFSTSTFCILQCLHRLVSVWFWSRMIFCTLVLTTVNIMINPCCGSHVPDVSFLAAQYEFNVASWDPIRNIPPGPKLHISKIVQITVLKSKTYLFFWVQFAKKNLCSSVCGKAQVVPVCRSATPRFWGWSTSGWPRERCWQPWQMTCRGVGFWRRRWRSLEWPGSWRWGSWASSRGRKWRWMGRMRYQIRYQTYPNIWWWDPKHNYVTHIIPNIPKLVGSCYLKHIQIPGSTFSPGPSCYQPHFAVVLGRS